MAMSMVRSSWHSHCDSTPDSSENSVVAAADFEQNNRLGPLVRLIRQLHHHCHLITTQPES